MITDIHRHFVPQTFLDFMKSRPEFQITVKREEGEIIDFDIRGMHFGLNRTFFDLPRQIERMRQEGVERSILSLATPFIDYHLNASLAVPTARQFNAKLEIRRLNPGTEIVIRFVQDFGSDKAAEKPNAA